MLWLRFEEKSSGEDDPGRDYAKSQTTEAKNLFTLRVPDTPLNSTIYNLLGRYNLLK